MYKMFRKNLSTHSIYIRIPQLINHWSEKKQIEWISKLKSDEMLANLLMLIAVCVTHIDALGSNSVVSFFSPTGFILFYFIKREYRSLIFRIVSFASIMRTIDF